MISEVSERQDRAIERAHPAILVVLVLLIHWGLYNALMYTYYEAVSPVGVSRTEMLLLGGSADLISVGICLAISWRRQLIEALTSRFDLFTWFLALGTVIGGVTVCLYFAGIICEGALIVRSLNHGFDWFGCAADAIMFSIARATLYVGFVFYVIERKWGTLAALCVSSITCGIGLTHGWQPGPHVPALLETAVTACLSGLLFSAGYAAYRQLWFAVGLNFGGAMFKFMFNGDSFSGMAPFFRTTEQHGAYQPFGVPFWTYCAAMLLVTIPLLCDCQSASIKFVALAAVVGVRSTSKKYQKLCHNVDAICHPNVVTDSGIPNSNRADNSGHTARVG